MSLAQSAYLSASAPSFHFLHTAAVSAVISASYGQALAIRGRAAFDELRQGIRDIESIADPGTSEVKIGCPESLAAFLVLVIERCAQQYPRMRFQVQQVSW